MKKQGMHDYCTFLVHALAMRCKMSCVPVHSISQPLSCVAGCNGHAEHQASCVKQVTDGTLVLIDY